MRFKHINFRDVLSEKAEGKKTEMPNLKESGTEKEFSKDTSKFNCSNSFSKFDCFSINFLAIMTANEVDERPVPKFPFENDIEQKMIKQGSMIESKKISKQNSKESLKAMNESKVLRKPHECSCNFERLHEKKPSNQQILKEQKNEPPNKLSKFFKDEKNILLKQEIVQY